MIISPKIIILLSTYNRSELIWETLNSILEQTYTNWECVIVDDHSVDETKDVVERYVKKDHRFSYYLKTNLYKKGLSGSRNYGLDIARDRNASFIQFFDDDDLMHPKKLELQMLPLIENFQLNFSVCKFEKIVFKNGDSTIIKPEQQLVFPHLGDAILTGKMKMNSLGPLWRSEFINKYRFDENFDYAEEWELYTRIGYAFPENYAPVDEYLFQYRKHSQTLTLQEDKNYLKRKTSAVIRIKILDFLTDNGLHTKTSILFLANTFLVYSYTPHLVQKLLIYVQQNEGFSRKMSLFLKIGLALGKFYRKLISKLGKCI
ncbi:glycosyltransferase [Antarcticibacterium arcticum]|uniref:Glycosyltransferase n=1 Tax=Antarcticibacterium arcticum TaxID=2585771 RepID=A0A5B8YKM7_9FLAO|nr:glycosyltransferase family 2 protein [Antarcticibacterium arcticum]QED37758.1 glycosyltransferase [Antarcticibacterium arcticum]